MFVSSFFKQFFVLLERSFIATLRSPIATFVRALQNIILSLVAGFIFYQVGNGQDSIQSIQGLGFFIIINQSFGGLFATLQTFPLERPILLREHEAGTYRIDAFYYAKTLADLPFQIVFPTFFLVIVWFLSGVSEDADRFGLFLAALLLTTNAAFSMGFFISCLAPAVEIALGIAPVLLLPFLLTGGFFANSDNLGPGISWVEAISFFKYGFTAYCVIIFQDREFECDVPPGQPCFSNGDQIISALSMEPEDLVTSFIALAGLVIGFRLLGLLALEITASRRQNE
jgi:ABC-type multidrug transport system permease subunit